MASPDALEALRQECDLVSKAVLDLAPEDYERPTRCTEWNVKELLAHMYRDVERLIVGVTEPPPDAPDTDSVSYWRAYDPRADSADIADRAKQRAASYGRGRELAIVWDDMWRRACELAAGESRERVVVTWAPALTLDEFLRTRVLEITVHGADLADALGRDPWPTRDGMAITTEILAGILGDALPEGLGWDDLTFVEKGTGRAAVMEADREALGALADRFPLMG